MRVLSLTAVLVLGYCLGQISYALGQTGTAASAPDIFWNLITTSGPMATLLGFILWRVDLERRRLLTEREALLERVINGLNNGTESIRSIAATNTSLLGAFNSLADFIRGQGKGV